MVERPCGRFPADYHQALSLPGVGDYTARAVLSIAYNQPYAALDGNVARVVARLLALRGNLHQPRFRPVVEKRLQRLLPPRRPGDFNQALMELGQTVCLPPAARCPACPLKAWCRAYALGQPESYPERRPRRATETRFLAATVIRRKGRVAMVRGLDEGLLGDLWNFPAAFGSSRAEALQELREKLSSLLGKRPRFGSPLGEIRHAITHRDIRVIVYPTAVADGRQPDGLRWSSVSRLLRAPASTLARKIAAVLVPQGVGALASQRCSTRRETLRHEPGSALQ